MKVKIKNKGPIAWMVNNPVAANLLMLIFLVGGLLMFKGIPQEFLPDVSPSVVRISIAYPGAGPEEVERGIVLAVEEAVRGIDGIDDLYSVAHEGGASIRAELIDGASVDQVYQDIKSAVDRITTFPENAESPQISIASIKRSVLNIIMYGSVDDKALREQGEQFRDMLLQQQSITQVEMSGIRPLEIKIEIPQENLRRYNLTLRDVSRRLAMESVEIPGGKMKTGSGEILLRVTDRRDYGREFGNIPIISRSDGSRVLLKDIAIITDGFKDTDRYARYNGKPAIMFDVYRVGKQTPSAVESAARVCVFP